MFSWGQCHNPVCRLIADINCSGHSSLWITCSSPSSKLSRKMRSSLERSLPFSLRPDFVAPLALHVPVVDVVFLVILSFLWMVLVSSGGSRCRLRRSALPEGSPLSADRLLLSACCWPGLAFKMSSRLLLRDRIFLNLWNKSKHYNLIRSKQKTLCVTFQSMTLISGSIFRLL